MEFCGRPPLLLDFCLGGSSNFVGSESGQVRSDKLLQNMVSNRTPFPPPPTHCICTYIQYTYSHKEGGGGVEPERRLEGNSSQSRVENTNMTECFY
jgi:hypothetical protein